MEITLNVALVRLLVSLVLGCAIGIERLIVKMLDLGNIREAILFPRDPARLTP